VNKNLVWPFDFSQGRNPLLSLRHAVLHFTAKASAKVARMPTTPLPQ
jgi:hypothetical protein